MGTRRRRWLWAVAVGVVVLVAFVLVWFQPQKLVIDESVDEAAPSAGTVTELARGSFVSLDHGTTGTAVVVELGDGTRVLRIEGLDTSNGPDLFVYLSANRADGPEGAFDDEYLSLGRLKGNKGDQNYDVPAGTALDRYASVVVWCDRFDSAFGAADLMPA